MGHRRRQDADANRHRSREEERSPERQGPGSSLQIGRAEPLFKGRNRLARQGRRSGPARPRKPATGQERQGRKGELANALPVGPASSAALPSGRLGLQLDPAARRGALEAGAPLPPARGRDPPLPFPTPPSSARTFPRARGSVPELPPPASSSCPAFGPRRHEVIHRPEAYPQPPGPVDNQLEELDS